MDRHQGPVRKSLRLRALAKFEVPSNSGAASCWAGNPNDATRGVQNLVAYISLYVYIHMVYIHTYVYIHTTRIRMYNNMYTYMYVCMYACMHVCMHACMHACMHVCMYVYMYVCLHNYICTSLPICIYICVCVYICSGQLPGRYRGYHATTLGSMYIPEGYLDPLWRNVRTTNQACVHARTYLHTSLHMRHHTNVLTTRNIIVHTHIHIQDITHVM